MKSTGNRRKTLEPVKPDGGGGDGCGDDDDVNQFIM